MLFRKDIEPCCCYCQHSQPMNETQAACEKRGIVPLWGKCRRFKYDPLRRVPPKPVAPLDRGDPEAFKL